MAEEKDRLHVPQSEVPRWSLEEALRVVRAMHERFNLVPARLISVAEALGLQPTSSHFRTLAGASIAYGLISGGYSAERVEITSLGKRIVAPTSAGDGLLAKRQAVIQPRVARDFYFRYDSKPMPRGSIARNVLIDLGVPKGIAGRVLALLIDNAKDVGILRMIKGDAYLDLDGSGLWLSGQSQDSDVSTEQVARSTRSTSGGTMDVSFSHSLVPVSNMAPQKKRTSSALRRGLEIDAYQLMNRLGSGFSAEVWEAKVTESPAGVDLREGQIVAVKFYHAHAMAVPDQVIRIEREYRIAQQIIHPNLIRIYEYVLASSRPFHNFLVMDIAPGTTLKSYISPAGVSVQKAVVIARQLLSALDELHGAGALHRDIKPGNISVDDGNDGVKAVLLDLGIVTVQHEKSLTVATRFLGSKHWAPYEQLVGDPLDFSSDIYAFGAVFYNMLTGDIPYGGRTTEAAIAVEMSRKPLRLPDSIQIDASLRELVNDCLSTDQRSRPMSAKECLTRLNASSGYRAE